MEKHYLYLLLGVFIFINGVGYFDEDIKHTVKQEELLKYKLRKQELYDSHIEEIKKILAQQKMAFVKNREPFFAKEKKETIVFSEIQQSIQLIFKNIGGKIIQSNSGVVIKNEFYKKYPITLTLEVIPEDLDDFFKKLYKIKKYLFIDSIHISRNKRMRILSIRITLIGYQLQ